MSGAGGGACFSPLSHVKQPGAQQVLVFGVSPAPFTVDSCSEVGVQTLKEGIIDCDWEDFSDGCECSRWRNTYLVLFLGSW